MILKSLYDYAQSKRDSLPPNGMEWTEIEFVIVIDAEGHFKRFENKRTDKRSCVSFLVAKRIKRTSAPKSNILWDNGKYVLGKGDGGEKCNALFVEIVKDIAERYPEDASIQAVLKFYSMEESVREETMKMHPLYEKVMVSPNANISFRYLADDNLIAEKAYLFAHLLGSSSENYKIGRCLITGTKGPLVRTTTPTPLPNNSPMAALVAFQVNSGYDSYGKTQAYNSPISLDAEEAISTALKMLLAKDSKNKHKLGTRMFLFWGSGNSQVKEEVENGFSRFSKFQEKDNNNQDENIIKVEELFKAINSGRIKTTLDDRFHILGLAPNTGRIAVVLWMASPLKDFAGKMLSHFEDMEIVDTRHPDNRRPYVGVYPMVASVSQGGKIKDQGGKISNTLQNLIDETVKTVIFGTPYPFRLYTGALQRIKAELSERGPTIQRVAILKAYLNRQYRNQPNYKPLTVMLDKDNRNPGYLCGRLTAILEKIQSDAKSGDSIRTRYMGAALTTPAAIIPTMLMLSRYHSEKLLAGSRINYEKMKREIVDQLTADGGFPVHLDRIDQGRFFVGYYHQQAYLYTKKEDRQ